MPALDSLACPAGAPAPKFLRLSAGFVYFYFGFVKFYTDLSPAELLASQTIMRMVPWQMDADTVLFGLAAAEVIIGAAFLLNCGLRWVLWIFLLHQLGTFAPLLLFPEITFKFFPFAPTMEGQYIVKNLVSFAAGLTVMLPAVRGKTARDAAARAARKAEAARARSVDPSVDPSQRRKGQAPAPAIVPTHAADAPLSPEVLSPEVMSNPVGSTRR